MHFYETKRKVDVNTVRFLFLTLSLTLLFQSSSVSVCVYINFATFSPFTYALQWFNLVLEMPYTIKGLAIFKSDRPESSESFH